MQNAIDVIFSWFSFVSHFNKEPKIFMNERDYTKFCTSSHSHIIIKLHNIIKYNKTILMQLNHKPICNSICLLFTLTFAYVLQFFL